MKLTITYAKCPSEGTVETFGSYRYEVNTDIADKDTFEKTITSIMDSYGDYALDHYMEKDADVFACYMDDEKEPVYVSDKNSKKDPLAIVDGIIRRSKVSSVVLAYDGLVYVLEEPKADTEDKNNIILSSYNVTLSKENKDTYTLSGSNITVFFPYRDGEYSTIPNKKCADNVTPFFYVLKGNLHEEANYPELSYYDESTDETIDEPAFTIKTDTAIKELKIRIVPYYDSVVYVVSGVYSQDCNNDAYPDGESNSKFEGLFFSMNESYIFKTGDLTNVYAWLSAYVNNTYVGRPDDNRMRVHDTQLEEIIKTGEFSDTEVLNTMSFDLYNCINDALHQRGISISDEFITETKTRASENLQFLSKKQSETLFNIFSYNDNETTKYHCPLKKVYDITQNALDKFPNITFDENGMAENEFDNLNEEISLSVSIHENSNVPEDRFPTAIHEMGHAVAGNMLAPEHKGVWEMITIVPSDTKGYDGCCYLSNEYYALLDTTEKRIMKSLGGLTAEELCLEDNGGGWSQDYLNCKGMLTEILLSDKIEFLFDEKEEKIKIKYEGSAYLTTNIRDQLLSKLRQQTRELLKDEKEHIETLARRIMETEEKEIDGETFDAWFKEVCG